MEGIMENSLIHSINPATEQILKTYKPHSVEEVENKLQEAQRTARLWKSESFAVRRNLMSSAAKSLRRNKAQLAQIITLEMGKPITQSEAEIEKCARNCDFYAENGEQILKNEPRDSGASESYIAYEPLGVILAVMPWNFPFWQVFRFAAPALMAGNGAILKHASNVPQCALAIEQVFREAGFPENLFQTLLMGSSAVHTLIEHPVISAVTLTGSDGAGKEVASCAGRMLKKTVMELGGSDPFIILEDANLDEALRIGLWARTQNAGQSCIAAKRFIIVEPLFEEYQNRFVEALRGLRIGDPMDPSTQIGPLARGEFRDDLERQIRESVQKGATVLTGGTRLAGKGYYFEPTVLTGVGPDMPAACEELFGPVAVMMRARDSEEAIALANNTPYGLGSSIWTSNIDLAKKMARRIEAGQVFINGMVASDSRLPFGGVKRSGYGRELSELGMREFVNIQTVWIGPAK